jgi:hypothetical protein
MLKQILEIGMHCVSISANISWILEAGKVNVLGFLLKQETRKGNFPFTPCLTICSGFRPFTGAAEIC